MRTGFIIQVTAADRARLEAVIADRNSPQKHVWRARIVLLTAAGHGTNEIMRQANVAKTAVWRWQERFMQAGVDGLLRDKTRPSHIPPLDQQVAALTLTDPPGETTHWTAAAMAQASAVLWSSHTSREREVLCRFLGGGKGTVGVKHLADAAADIWTSRGG